MNGWRTSAGRGWESLRDGLGWGGEAEDSGDFGVGI